MSQPNLNFMEKMIKGGGVIRDERNVMEGNFLTTMACLQPPKLQCSTFFSSNRKTFSHIVTGSVHTEVSYIAKFQTHKRNWATSQTR